jgi:LysM repeat protein
MEPAMPSAAAPGTYTIERGDTLAKIATKFYGNPKKRTAIARANPGLDSNRLKVGQVIKLPDLPTKQEQTGAGLVSCRKRTDSGNTASDHVRGSYWAEPSALFRSLGKECLQLLLDLGIFAVGTLNLLRVMLTGRHGQVKSLTALLTYVFIDRHRITSHSTASRSY